jgi:hypothetical protein
LFEAMLEVELSARARQSLVQKLEEMGVDVSQLVKVKTNKKGVNLWVHKRIASDQALQIEKE